MSLPTPFQRYQDGVPTPANPHANPHPNRVPTPFQPPVSQPPYTPLWLEGPNQQGLIPRWARSNL